MRFVTSIIVLSAFGLQACGQAAESNARSPEATVSATTAAETSVADAAAPEDAYKVPSGSYGVDKTHGYISFSYNHQGYSKPLLRWRDWDSTIIWDADNPASSVVTVSINAASIDSGVDVFDGHLRGDKFFDVEVHPEISFVSTAITPATGTTGTMTGDLTIKGVTKPLILDVTFNKQGFYERGNSNKIGFSATGTLVRSDWGLGMFSPVVSDEVDLVIETEYLQPVVAE